LLLLLLLLVKKIVQGCDDPNDDQQHKYVPGQFATHFTNALRHLVFDASLIKDFPPIIQKRLPSEHPALRESAAAPTPNAAVFFLIARLNEIVWK
jgi:hypothetical protein